MSNNYFHMQSKNYFYIIGNIMWQEKINLSGNEIFELVGYSHKHVFLKF